MNIVHIEDFFHPDAGYQVNILSKYQSRIGNDVTIVTSKPDKLPDTLKRFFDFTNIEEIDREFYDSYKVKVIRVDLRAYISGRSIYYSKIFKVIDGLKPDIVYVHGNDTYIGIRYILKSNRLKFPIISDNHMTEIASNNKYRNIFRFLYRQLVTRKIVSSAIPVIRMSNDDFVQLNYKIPKRLAPTIGFGSDLLLFYPDQEVKYDMRRRLNVPLDSFVILYAGKLDAAKGGLFLAESIRDKIVSSKDISFVIIGNFVGDYGVRVRTELNLSENRVICFPTQKYIDLPKYYNMADVAVFPKQCSLSFYDVQACGLPVLLENNDINKQRITCNNGVLFKADDKDDFRSKLSEVIEMPIDSFNQMKQNSINYVKDNYNYQDVCQIYMDIIYRRVSDFYKLKSKS